MSGSTKQLPASQLAYNLQLWAYNPAIASRVENQIIKIQALRNLSAGDAVQQVNRSSTKPTLLPAKEELDFDMSDSTILSAVIVGIRPCHSRATRANNESYGDKMLLRPVHGGYSVNTLKMHSLLPHDPNTRRVICPRFAAIATFYALAEQDPQSKLCTGVIVGKNEVFFFPEFRNDDETTLADRESTCSQKVRNAVGKTKFQRDEAFEPAAAINTGPIPRLIVSNELPSTQTAPRLPADATQPEETGRTHESGTAMTADSNGLQLRRKRKAI